MNKNQKVFELVFKALDKNADNQLTQEGLLLAFAEHGLPLAQSELLHIFSTIDKDLDNRLSYEETRLWFFQPHPVTVLDSLFYCKLRLLGLFSSIPGFFSSVVGAQPLSLSDKRLNSALFTLKFGEEPAVYASKACFSLDFSDSINTGDKLMKDLVYGAVLRFRLEKTAKNPPQIFEEFQKNCKGLVLVAQNLNKKLKEILKELNFSYQLLEGKDICVSVRFSDNVQKFLADFQETVNAFMLKAQKAESISLAISLRSDLETIVNRFLESPIVGLTALLADSKVEFSGFIQKIVEGLIEISKEKLGSQRLTDLFSLFLMLRAMKLALTLTNLTAEDIENSGAIELFPEQSFFLGEIPKFELPKLPIIKKFYQMFGNGFLADLKVGLRCENVSLRARMRGTGVLKVFDRFFKVQ